MNPYLTLIILAVGVVLGYFWAKAKHGNKSKNIGGVFEQKNREQEARKIQQKHQVMGLFSGNPAAEIRNNDVEKLLGVSDSTAERYLNELEQEGKVVQHGEVGRDVFYTQK